MANERKDGQAAKKRVEVPMATFIQVWEKHAKLAAEGKGNRVEDVAAELNLAKGSVETKATKLRRERGIPLTEFPRGGGGQRFDRDEALAELAAIRGMTVEQLKAEGDALVAEAEQRRAEKEAEATDEAPAGEGEATA